MLQSICQGLGIFCLCFHLPSWFNALSCYSLSTNRFPLQKICSNLFMAIFLGRLLSILFHYYSGENPKHKKVKAYLGLLITVHPNTLQKVAVIKRHYVQEVKVNL